MYKLPPNVVVFLGLSDNVDWRIGQIATSVTAFPVPVAKVERMVSRSRVSGDSRSLDIHVRDIDQTPPQYRTAARAK